VLPWGEGDAAAAAAAAASAGALLGEEGARKLPPGAPASGTGTTSGSSSGWSDASLANIVETDEEKESYLQQPMQLRHWVSLLLNANMTLLALDPHLYTPTNPSTSAGGSSHNTSRSHSHSNSASAIHNSNSTNSDSDSVTVSVRGSPPTQRGSGVPGGTVGVPGGTVGVPGGTVGVPGGTAGVQDVEAYFRIAIACVNDVAPAAYHGRGRDGAPEAAPGVTDYRSKQYQLHVVGYRYGARGLTISLGNDTLLYFHCVRAMCN